MQALCEDKEEKKKLINVDDLKDITDTNLDDDDNFLVKALRDTLNKSDIDEEEKSSILDRMCGDYSKDIDETDYDGRLVYTCPICGTTFFADKEMEEEEPCPVCGEVPSEFYLCGKIEQTSTGDVSFVTSEEEEKISDLEDKINELEDKIDELENSDSEEDEFGDFEEFSEDDFEDDFGEEEEENEEDFNLDMNGDEDFEPLDFGDEEEPEEDTEDEELQQEMDSYHRYRKQRKQMEDKKMVREIRNNKKNNRKANMESRRLIKKNLLEDFEDDFNDDDFEEEDEVGALDFEDQDDIDVLLDTCGVVDFAESAKLRKGVAVLRKAFATCYDTCENEAQKKIVTDKLSRAIEKDFEHLDEFSDEGNTWFDDEGDEYIKYVGKDKRIVDSYLLFAISDILDVDDYNDM